MATSEVEPGELAGASSGARTEGEPEVLFPEIEPSLIGATGDRATEDGAVGILNLVNLIF